LFFAARFAVAFLAVARLAVLFLATRFFAAFLAAGAVFLAGVIPCRLSLTLLGCLLGRLGRLLRRCLLRRRALWIEHDLECGRRRELHTLGGCDVHGRAGLRIATDARRA